MLRYTSPLSRTGAAPSLFALTINCCCRCRCRCPYLNTFIRKYISAMSAHSPPFGFWPDKPPLQNCFVANDANIIVLLIASSITYVRTDRIHARRRDSTIFMRTFKVCWKKVSRNWHNSVHFTIYRFCLSRDMPWRLWPGAPNHTRARALVHIGAGIFSHLPNPNCEKR